MKKTIIFILIILILLPSHIYGVKSPDYLDAHIIHIEDHTNYDIKNVKRLIKDNPNSNTIEILKSIYSSLDPYSSFYSKEELARNIFEKDTSANKKSIEHEIKEDIGYIYIHTFNDHIYDKTLDILKLMDVEKIEKIVIDLRDNKGGDLLESIKIAGLFVKEGLIARIHYYSDESEDIEYHSKLKEEKYKLLVLVNEETASAAELFAAAIQDSGSGYIVGDKTFGKAKIQKSFPIISEEAYKRKSFKKATVNLFEFMKKGARLHNDDLLGWAIMTTGTFYSRSGREIHGRGIKPDYSFDARDGNYLKNLFTK